MADRDPDTIKQDIELARDQLAVDGRQPHRTCQSAQNRRGCEVGTGSVREETAGGDLARRDRRRARGAVRSQAQALISPLLATTPFA